MRQVIALKIAAAGCALLWAFVAHHNRWSIVLIFALCVIHLAFGASAARDLAYISRDEP